MPVFGKFSQGSDDHVRYSSNDMPSVLDSIFPFLHLDQLDICLRLMKFGPWHLPRPR